jgi:hypothetical protein
MAKILSGKVKKVPSTQVSADRYNFLELSEAEPDLGVPSSDNYVLTSLSNGTRTWKNISDLTGFTITDLDGGSAANDLVDVLNFDGGNA